MEDQRAVYKALEFAQSRSDHKPLDKTRRGSGRVWRGAADCLLWVELLYYYSTGTSASVAYLEAIISWSTDNTEAKVRIKQLTSCSYTTRTVAQFWCPGRVNTMATPDRNCKFYKSVIEFPFIRLDNLKFVASARKYFI
jgi:hypothetical protein